MIQILPTQTVLGNTPLPINLILDNYNFYFSYFPIYNYKQTGMQFTHLNGGRRRNREIKRIVLHHDATLSAKHCYDILKRRNLGTDFAIDNNGDVYQFSDPIQLSTWASGNYNQTSINIDISNAVLPRYKDRYDIPRDIKTKAIHGRNVTGMIPYPVQIRSTAVLIAFLLEYLGLPTNVNKNYKVDSTLSPRDTKYSVIGHYHFARNKIDPFGVDWKELENLIVEYRKYIYLGG